MKVTRNDIKREQELKRYTARAAKNREKIILQSYILLSKDIEKEFLKGDIEDVKEKISEIIDNKFKGYIQTSLFKIARLNIKQFTEYFTEKFKRNINLDDLQEIKSKLLNKFLSKYSGHTVVDVSETTKRILNKRITEYSGAGYSYKDLVKKIIEDTKGEIGKKRAMIIARTETQKAIGETNYQTAVKAKLKNKTWLHLGGGKTDRTSHKALHGKTVPIKEKFDVGAEGQTPAVKMRFPKDPECRVAGQIINCECGIKYSR